MNYPQMCKWIDQVSSSEYTEEFAAQVLRLRLDAVLRYLALAAERSSENTEYVHQLRVNTRRALATVEIFSDLLEPKEQEELERSLAEIRRAAGKARDCDVLIGRLDNAHELAELGLLTRLCQKREKAQPAIVAAHENSQSNRIFTCPVSDFFNTDCLSHKGHQAQFGYWSRSRLRRAVKAFFKAQPGDLKDLQALHRFRIASKQLRYTIELLAPAFPTRLRKKVYPAIAKLQDRLGEINDQASAIARFRKWKRKADNNRQANVYGLMLAAEKKGLKSSVKAFKCWWTRKRLSSLKREFNRLLKGAG